MSKTTTSRKTLRRMTPKAIEAAAPADSDAQPLTSGDLKRMKRTPQAKIIRRALGLTQEEFAAHYHIPLGTLRDWEQGRAEPDQPTLSKGHCTRTRARRAPIESKVALERSK
jgi:DNA-binding transcriptional regulator YiaG